MEFVGGVKREVRGFVPVLQEIFRFPLQCCNALVRHGLTLLFQEVPSPLRLPVRNCVRSRQKYSDSLEPWPIDRGACPQRRRKPSAPYDPWPMDR